MLVEGQLIDKKYRVSRLLGQGGMGAVYAGVHERIGKPVAIKVLHPEFARQPEIIERFEREARAAAEIGSDHIVDVFDLGELPNGERYFVMEYLQGRNLGDILTKRTTLPPREIVPIAVQILRALIRAHACEIIHRDLKPDNVFLAETPHGTVVKLLDFGVSKFSRTRNSNSTKCGLLMGTPAYMAPEQARGDSDLGPTADLYAVGVLLYQALSGKLPRWAENPNTLLYRVALEPHTPLQQVAPHLDLRLCQIIEKALAPTANDRYACAEEFEQALVEWFGQTISSPTLPAPAIVRSTQPKAERYRWITAAFFLVAFGSLAAVAIPRLLYVDSAALALTEYHLVDGNGPAAEAPIATAIPTVPVHAVDSLPLATDPAKVPTIPLKQRATAKREITQPQREKSQGSVVTAPSLPAVEDATPSQVRTGKHVGRL